jgi:hypothetical protein
MPKNTPAPVCPKCSKPQQFVLVKTGGRKFRCLDCDGEDPLRSPDVQRLLAGALKVSKAASVGGPIRAIPRHDSRKPAGQPIDANEWART